MYFNYLPFCCSLEDMMGDERFCTNTPHAKLLRRGRVKSADYK